jgi:hypothetical protein
MYKKRADKTALFFWYMCQNLLLIGYFSAEPMPFHFGGYNLTNPK